MQEHAAEATIAGIAQKVGMAGGGSAVVLAGFDINVLAAIAGVVVGVIGLVVQIYYKVKSNRREAEFHAARMQDLRGSE